MDIRININFFFEEVMYTADILILNLSTVTQKFFYVVHIFDEQLVEQFSRRYIFIAREKKFLPVKTKTKKEDLLVYSIQSAIINHRNNPFSNDDINSFISIRNENFCGS